MRDAITEHVQVRSDSQGWTDAQMVTALILLNLAGGQCVEDLEKLENDLGFAKILVDSDQQWAEGRTLRITRFRSAALPPIGSLGSIRSGGMSGFRQSQAKGCEFRLCYSWHGLFNVDGRRFNVGNASRLRQVAFDGVFRAWVADSERSKASKRRRNCARSPGDSSANGLPTSSGLAQRWHRGRGPDNVEVQGQSDPSFAKRMYKAR